MAGRRKLLLERFPATAEQRPLYQLCVSHFRNGRSDFTRKGPKLPISGRCARAAL